MSEVEERIARIQQHNGVKGLLIVTYKNGLDEMPAIVKSTMPQGDEATAYAVRLSRLAVQASNLVRDLDPSNDLTFLRVECKNLEMMIAPDKDYFLIVIQNKGELEAQQ